MKKTRLKAGGLTSDQSFLAAVDQIVNDEADLRALQVRCDKAVNRIKERYAERARPIAAAISTNLLLCEKYASDHRATLYSKDSKSDVSALAKHGFRGNPPSLATLEKWTWKKVLKKLADWNLTAYIRVKTEVDKETILADFKKHGCLRIEDPDHDAAYDVKLGTVGLCVEQEETFFIEPLTEGGETVKAPAGAAAQE